MKGAFQILKFHGISFLTLSERYTQKMQDACPEPEARLCP